MTLRRSVLVSAIVTALTFLIGFLLTAGGSSASMAAGTLAASVDTTAVGLEVAAEAVATTVETTVVAPTTTTAPVVMVAPATTPPTAAKPKAVTVPVPTPVRPPAVTSATVITVPAKTTNGSVQLSSINSTVTGSSAVRLVESSSGSVATVDTSLAGLTEGNYVVQLSYEFGAVETGYAVCSFAVTSQTSGGCSGELEVPEGVTLLMVFVTTLHNSFGGAAAEGPVALS